MTERAKVGAAGKRSHGRKQVGAPRRFDALRRLCAPCRLDAPHRLGTLRLGTLRRLGTARRLGTSRRLDAPRRLGTPHRFSARRLALPLAAAALLGASLAGCVYRIDVQQGNLLEEEAIQQVDVGMTRSQVQFLLGTPMVADAFHENRWDYPYYFVRGRSDEVERRWLVVYFDGDRVVRLERELELRPSPSS